ncbi:MAG: Ig domain-containing protein [Anaerolineales bacterium]|jgi:hypothetical protein|nr:Ig domain-containing protein [Anaerolineales bacterium]
MNRPLKLGDLFFSGGRARWSNNLFVKLGLGCVAAIFLCCLCGLCFWLWVFTADTRAAPVFSPKSLPAAGVGQAYETTISISNNATPVGDFWIGPGELPPGLSLQHLEPEDRAMLSGIPTQAGSYTFTISIWCYGTNVSGQTGAKEYTIIVEE